MNDRTAAILASSIAAEMQHDLDKRDAAIRLGIEALEALFREFGLSLPRGDEGIQCPGDQACVDAHAALAALKEVVDE